MALPIEDLQELARKKAVAAGIPVEPFLRQIGIESAWNPDAVGPPTRIIDPQTGERQRARGLGQFMPGTARQYGLTNPFDPDANLTASANYMADLLKLAKGDYGVATTMYNFGPGNVLAGKPLPPETQNYRAQIMGNAPIAARQQLGPVARQRTVPFVRPVFAQSDMSFPAIGFGDEDSSLPATNPTPASLSPQDNLLSLFKEDKPQIQQIQIDEPEAIAEKVTQPELAAPSATPLALSHISQIPISPLAAFRARAYAPTPPIIPIDIPETTEPIPPKAKVQMRQELRSLTKQNKALRQKLTRGRKA